MRVGEQYTYKRGAVDEVILTFVSDSWVNVFMYNGMRVLSQNLWMTAGLNAFSVEAELALGQHGFRRVKDAL